MLLGGAAWRFEPSFSKMTLCLPATFQLTHTECPCPMFLRVCAPTIANPRNITRDQISGSHSSVKHLIPSSQPKASYEQSKKEPHQTSLLDTSRDISLVSTRQEVEAEKQAALNKVGIVPPRTKSPTDEEVTPSRVVRRNANGLTNGLSTRVSIPLQASRARAG